MGNFIMRKLFYIVICGMVLFFAVSDGWQYYRSYVTQDATPTPTPTPTPNVIVGTPEPVVNNNIVVAAPAKDAVVSLPFTVLGSARVFENTVAIKIKDGETGKVVYENFTTAGSIDAGQFGPYTHTVTYLDAMPTGDRVILEVFWHSPEDGRALDVAIIPLILNKESARSAKIFFTNDTLDPEVT